MPLHLTSSQLLPTSIPTKLYTAARAYLDRVEALAGVPIAMVSTGPDRDETILRHHPFH